ncbi:Hypothetical predicted protein [Cloeon dipterum]|uniref:Uncharacterized protein n=1 Tax=Cloeon dipterum TaxID=197152 RepID=A0A8S1DGN8_9INSE|nr:Hypothetical predicted protein [Cloeon dipterum]
MRIKYKSRDGENYFVSASVWLNLKLRARAFHPRADAEDRNNPQLAFPLRQSSLHNTRVLASDKNRLST